MATNLRRTVLTQTGINHLYDGSLGPHYAVKYFLPIYDPRIDDVIHDPSFNQDTTDATGVKVYPLSATENVGTIFSTLEGEKLYNANSQYLLDHLGLSDSSQVWTSQTSATSVYLSTTGVDSLAFGYSGNVTRTSTAVNNSSQYSVVQANLINNLSAFSDVASAASLSANTLGDFEGTNVLVTKQPEPPFQLFGGSNTSATSLLYEIDGYNSITSAGLSVKAGRYTLKLESDAGDFRFNKFVMFISKMNPNGTEDTGALPIPFAITSFEGTQKKQRTIDSGNNLLWRGVAQIVFTAPTSAIDVTSLVVSNWSDTGVDSFGLTTAEQVQIYSSGSSPNSVDSKFAVEGDPGQKQIGIISENDNEYFMYTNSVDELNVSGVGGLNFLSSATNIAGDVTIGSSPLNGANVSAYINPNTQDFRLISEDFSNNTTQLIISHPSGANWQLSASSSLHIEASVHFQDSVSFQGFTTFDSSVFLDGPTFIGGYLASDVDFGTPSAGTNVQLHQDTGDTFSIIGNSFGVALSVYVDPLQVTLSANDVLALRASAGIAAYDGITFVAGITAQAALQVWEDSIFLSNIGIGTSTFGTGSPEHVLSIENGTPPSGAEANGVIFYSTDLTAGNTMMSIYTEGTVTGAGTPTADRTIAIRQNGTVYYLLASTIP